MLMYKETMFDRFFKKQIRAGYFTGWRSVVKVNKLRAQIASVLTTYDWPTDSDILNNKSQPVRIYFDSNTQKLKTNMNESFRICNDSAILERVLEFPALLFGLKRVISCKNDVTPSIANITRLCDENQTGERMTSHQFVHRFITKYIIDFSHWLL